MNLRFIAQTIVVSRQSHVLFQCTVECYIAGVSVGGVGAGSGEGGTGSTGGHGDCHQENSREQGQRTVYVVDGVETLLYIRYIPPWSRVRTHFLVAESLESYLITRKVCMSHAQSFFLLW